MIVLRVVRRQTAWTSTRQTRGARDSISDDRLVHTRCWLRRTDDALPAGEHVSFEHDVHQGTAGFAR